MSKRVDRVWLRLEVWPFGVPLAFDTRPTVRRAKAWRERWTKLVLRYPFPARLRWVYLDPDWSPNSALQLDPAMQGEVTNEAYQKARKDPS